MAQIVERKGKNGKVTFCVRIRRKGAKDATASFKRRNDAKRWITETENAVIDGRYFLRAEERKHTVNEAFERFLRDYPKNRNLERHLKKWSKVIGHCLLSDINQAYINEVLCNWKRETNSAGETRTTSTLNRYLSNLSIVFTAACSDWQWIARNPIREVRRLKEPRGRVRFLSDDERKNLLEAAKTSWCPFLYLIVVLALSTGMRLNEIMTLKWDQIDFQKSVLVLLKTKNGEARRVAIRGLALELLKEHSKVRQINNLLLFPGVARNKLTGHFDIRKAWLDTRDRAKLKDFRFHDLRHSCASYLAMGGASLLEIAEVLGHKSLGMVKRYSHLADSHTASVVEKMNEKIFGR